MRMVLDAPHQQFFRGMRPPRRSLPSPEQLASAVDRNSRVVIARWHRGNAPREVDFDFESLRQEVTLGALRRLKIFRHGGRKTLEEFAYLACYQSLRDLQRAVIRRLRRESHEEQTYPLWEFED